MADFYLFQSTLRDLMRPRKLVAAVILAVLPTVIALIIRFQTPSNAFKGGVTYDWVEANLIFGFVLVILAVVFGTGAISQEMEQKTISYLLTRPVPRWRIVIVKFAAAFAVITATVWLASLLLALATVGPTGISRSALGRDCVILPVGALAYGAVFLLLAALFNKALLAGLVFAFGWESWVPQLPGDFHKVSLMSYLRALAPHSIPKPDSAGMAEMLTGAMEPARIPNSLAHWVLSIVIVLCLALAVAVFSTREYVPREDAD
ncbi:MAG: ABC transporter permease [Chloroflexi bacterium]|nr:ABC transporter permease [Chloroflexota bacterium]